MSYCFSMMYNNFIFMISNMYTTKMQSNLQMIRYFQDNYTCQWVWKLIQPFSWQNPPQPSLPRTPWNWWSWKRKIKHSFMLELTNPFPSESLASTSFFISSSERLYTLRRKSVHIMFINIFWDRKQYHSISFEPN